MVSYDDPTSFGELLIQCSLINSFSCYPPLPAAKGKFIASKGLAGFALWEAYSDHNDLLVDSIRSASGM